MKTLLKNKRSYQKRIGSTDQNSDEDIEMDDGNELERDDEQEDNEGGLNRD